MKKYLQACEIGGSIYGKKQTIDVKIASTSDNKQLNDDGGMDNWSRLYRKQARILSKFFRRKQ